MVRNKIKFWRAIKLCIASTFLIYVAVVWSNLSHRNQLSINNMSEEKTFACVANCMDGRIQNTVDSYMKEYYGVAYVDMVTEPGPNKIFAENKDKAIVENIKKRIEISVHHHGSQVVAIVGHFGCAGNPVSKEDQIAHLKEAKKTVESFGLGIKVILLWIGEGWQKAELVE